MIKRKNETSVFFNMFRFDLRMIKIMSTLWKITVMTGQLQTVVAIIADVSQ